MLPSQRFTQGLCSILHESAGGRDIAVFPERIAKKERTKTARQGIRAIALFGYLIGAFQLFDCFRVLMRLTKRGCKNQLAPQFVHWRRTCVCEKSVDRAPCEILSFRGL